MTHPTTPRCRLTGHSIRHTLAVMGAGLVAFALSGTAAATNPPSNGNSEWQQENVAGMDVLLYEPTTEPAKADGRALMITLHGCSQTASDIASSGGWQDTADQYGMVVAAPDAPNGGVLLGCWDYYNGNHTRNNRHNDNILSLVDELLGRSTLNIDPDQVYISGLSSGGGQAMVMTCLAPDVFAGSGNNAGPTIGTGSAAIGNVATDQSSAVRTCRDLAGSHADAFDTQIASMIYGSNDNTVAQGYNELNAQVKAELYGASTESTIDTTMLPGTNTNGSGQVIGDDQGPRVSIINNTGVGHEWPAGDGTGGNYITGDSVDYPAYLTAFLFENNRRVTDSGGDPDTPSVNITAPSNGQRVSDTVTIEASVTGVEDVSSVAFYVDDGLVGTASAPPYRHDWDTTAIGDGTHTLKAVATTAADETYTDDDTSVTVDNGGDNGDESSCWTATNTDHHAAGRANQLGVEPYTNYNAVGSYTWLGYADQITSLSRTGPDHYELVSSCP